MISESQIKGAEARLASATQNRSDTRARLRAHEVLVKDSPERRELRVKRLVEQATSRRWDAESADVNVSAHDTAMPGASVALERVLGKSDLMSVSYLERGLLSARTVGRVHIRTRRSGRLEGFGTGFLVGHQLLLTNNHVLPDKACGAFSTVEFGYEEGRLVGEPSFFLELDPSRFFASDVDLDYTLIGLRDPRGLLTSAGWNPLIRELGKITTDEYVSIIQHPEGQPKQVALRENRLVGVLAQHLIYHTDTAPGSSGSPVFNDQWEVVALHHAGVPQKDTAGRWLARDGRVWDASMGEQQIDWIANEGVRISSIVDHISTVQRLSDEERLAWTACLEVAPPTEPIGEATKAPNSNNIRQSRTSAAVASPARDPDGYSTWIVPIEVKLRIGPAQSVEPSQAPQVSAPPSGNLSVPVVPRAAVRDHRSVVDRPDSVSGDQFEALAVLGEAKSRPYYDEAEDAQARHAYYAGIALGNDPIANYEVLARLVTDTHTTEPRYRPAVEVYPWVDLHEDLMIRSIYSGQEYDPADLIEEDFRIERQRERFFQEMTVFESESPEAAYRAREALEAALPYNCEHVVPQSWFAKVEPMKGDLHHLFACECGCNSFRSNIPYFDFDNADEATRDACGRREGNRFEPVTGKGAVARATLYFLLRYPGEIDNSAEEYTTSRLRTLVQWCLGEDVTVYELHRNAAIFARQGNRNPFIDDPQRAALVDFSQGLA